MTQSSPTPRERLREPTAADEANLAKLRELCAQWGRDPEDFITRYLNLTTKKKLKTASKFFYDHPDKALAHFADKYLCANPIDGRIKDSAEVAPDADEIDIRLSMVEALRAAQRKQSALESPKMAKAVAPECPSTVVQCAPAKPVVLAPCSVLELKAAFTAQREARRMTHADIAGILTINYRVIVSAESQTTSLWPTFFQSPKVISAYAGDNDAIRLELEKKAHAVIYPNGINSIRDLVYCVAHRSGLSIEGFGDKYGVSRLDVKTNPKIKEGLNLNSRVALRKALVPEIPLLQHLGVSADILDTVLPDPIAIAHQGVFKDALNAWAEVAYGTKTKFAQAVGHVTEKEELSETGFYHWAEGKGLKDKLEPIITILKTNPNTKDIFPEYEQQFRELAAAVMKKPKHAISGSASEASTVHVARIDQQRGDSRAATLRR